MVFILGRELGLGKYTILAGRGLVELNQLLQCYLYTIGEETKSEKQAREWKAELDKISKKIDKLVSGIFSTSKQP